MTHGNIFCMGMKSTDGFHKEWDMIKYKRNSSILAGATLIALFVVACEKDEPKVHELVGTWISTSGTIYYGTSIAAADSSVANPIFATTVITIVFIEDNTGSITSDDGDYVGTDDFTWSTSGSELFFVGEDGTSLSDTPLTYDIKGATLTIIDHWTAEHTGLEQWRTVDLQKQ